MSTAVRLERGQACATTVSAATLFCSPRVIDYLPITVTRGYGEDESPKVTPMPKICEVFRTPENGEMLRKRNDTAKGMDAG